MRLVRLGTHRGMNSKKLWWAIDRNVNKERLIRSGSERETCGRNDEKGGRKEEGAGRERERGRGTPRTGGWILWVTGGATERRG